MLGWMLSPKPIPKPNTKTWLVDRNVVTNQDVYPESCPICPCIIMVSRATLSLLLISSCCLSTVLFKSIKCQKYDYLVWQYDNDINSSVAECESVHIYGSNTYTMTHSGVKWEFTARKYVIIASDGDQSSTKWKLQTGMNQGQSS